VLNVKWDRRSEKWELRDARELIEAAVQVGGYLALTLAAVLAVYNFVP